ncbi:MAG: PPOX class F420-dependent oxidoreductase [Chloroflexi bacterium]|nr:PPOX class F420-dependent oxidoreductase [Chloroflexota bacterium]
MFTEAELDYLNSNDLARLGTVHADSQQVDVVPVRYEFDGTYFYIGGHYMTASRKYLNVASGSPKVALVIDDMQPGEPPAIRGIRIYGTAEVVEREGWRGGISKQFKITPATHWSWGVEGPAFTEEGFQTNKVAWA